MYQNILIPVLLEVEHDHARAFQVASVAGPNAKVTLLHVMEHIPDYVAAYIPENTTQEMRAELQQEMDKLTSQVPGSEGKIMSGHAGRSIAKYAEDNAVDLIIVESHRPGFGDYFLGSTAGHIVRHVACAVHVIR